jgi:hypothetical protein
MLTFVINISFPKGYHRPDHSIESLDITGKNLYPFTQEHLFAFAVSSVVISSKNIRQDFTHSFCMKINSSLAGYSSSGQCTINLLNSEIYYTAEN